MRQRLRCSALSTEENMSIRSIAAIALCAANLIALPARAADPNELQQIREQINQLKESYEARMQALEQRLQAMQQGATGVVAASAPPPAPNAAPVTSQASASAFNPAISLILNGSYASLSQDPAHYRVQGFIPSGGEAGPGSRGFQLGESELSLSASIDPTFSGHLTFSLTGDNQVSVEEAVFERQGLFNGASLKAGRFLSSVGYLNSQHAHAWDFIDAPLVYQAFLGGQSKTDGLQLRWLAPTERFLELGAELGAGRSFPGSDTGRNGLGSSALFAHLGDDLGDNASWRIGLSYLQNKADDRAYGDTKADGTTPVTNTFTGTSRTWILDGIYKWAPNGNATQTNFKLQGEYFQRTEDGTLNYDTALGGTAIPGAYRATQSGWYMQAVYQFMPMWRFGVRYDKLNSGSPALGQVSAGLLSAADFPVLQSASPSRTSVMVDYSLSEFSRFRLQLSGDQSRPGITDNQIFLQYIMSLGAHGAHAF